ncbi:Adenosine deaminase [Schistosoma japonicum]|nr:Adenosine deaminase [Schistosoma japonicum]
MWLPLDLFGINLHVHLDGSIRPETLFELSNDEISKPQFKTLGQLKDKLTPKKPHSLKDFLKAFEIIIPLIAGKKEVLARICEEFVEDCVQRGGLCYVEIRYCPFLLADSRFNAEEVLKTILDSLNRASKKHGIEVRSILSIMRHMPETASETLELAKNYQPHGVVAIDVAGDDSVLKSQRLPNEIVQTFEEAKKAGIHRTVHVGENSPASSVYEAVNILHAERIGHGYHILDDEKAYKSLLQAGVHFEVCPSSSFVTGSVDSKILNNHPVHRFIEDKANFSINTDDPTLTERWDLQEAQYCLETLGIKPSQLINANYNAAMSAFLTTSEKEILISHINIRSRNRIIKIHSKT